MVLNRIKAAAQKGPGEVLAIPFKPFRWFFMIILWAIAILFTFLIIWAMFSLITQGQLDQRILITLQTLNIDKPIVKGLDFIVSITSGKYLTEQTQIGFAGTTTEIEEKIGINIRDFKPRESTVTLKRPILATALVEISKTPANQPIFLNFRDACYLQDYTEAQKETIVIPPTEKQIVAEQEGTVFQVRCEFPEGFNEIEPYGGKSTTETAGKIISERTLGIISQEKAQAATSISKDYDLKRLRLIPLFRYSQKIAWHPFTKELYSSSDKPMNPTWDVSNGPISLRIGSDESQPFYTNDEHMLYVYLSSNWPGQIKELTDIQIEAQNNMQILDNNQFCDFKRVGNVYKLTDEAKKKTKIDCTSKDTLLALAGVEAGRTSALTYDECIQKYKSEFKFSCPFVVTDAEKVASRTQLGVSANYIYEMQATTSITVLNKTLSGGLIA